jgi:hypothetical protein
MVMCRCASIKLYWLHWKVSANILQLPPREHTIQ